VLARGAAHRPSLLQDIVVCRFTVIDVVRQINAGSQKFEPGVMSSRYTARAKVGKHSEQSPVASCCNAGYRLCSGWWVLAHHAE
jgi:hypothetical protein